MAMNVMSHLKIDPSSTEMLFSTLLQFTCIFSKICLLFSVAKPRIKQIFYEKKYKFCIFYKLFNLLYNKYGNQNICFQKSSKEVLAFE